MVDTTFSQFALRYERGAFAHHCAHLALSQASVDACFPQPTAKCFIGLLIPRVSGIHTQQVYSCVDEFPKIGNYQTKTDPPNRDSTRIWSGVVLNSFTTFRFPGLAASAEVGKKHETSTRESAVEVKPSDEALISLVSKGDLEALGLLFRRYARVIRAIALRILRDPSEADDLLQDVFVLIHRFCRTFDSSKGSGYFWILQMTYRRAISRRRYLNARHFYTRVDFDEQAVQVVDSNKRQLHKSIDQVMARLDMQKIFGTLSQDQQNTLRMHFIEGYTLDEIAKMLGQTKGNVRHHSFRGLEKLRKQIFGGKLPGARAV